MPSATEHREERLLVVKSTRMARWSDRCSIVRSTGGYTSSSNITIQLVVVSAK